MSLDPLPFLGVCLVTSGLHAFVLIGPGDACRISPFLIVGDEPVHLSGGRLFQHVDKNDALPKSITSFCSPPYTLSIPSVLLESC